MVREILHRWRSFALGIFAVVVAVGSLTGALTLLKVHDLHTQKILTDKEAETEKKMAILQDEMRKATLKLSFNLLILPKQQDIRDLHIKGFPSEYMPEEYAERLANSGIITVRHFLPSLQQKIKWPEKKRTITLVGTRGEIPNLHKNPRQPLVQPVPPGTIVLGYGLHQSLGLQVGDKTELLGKEFTVHKCYEERGSKDDFTAWIHLGQAQELLDKKGLINAILALECLCKGVDDLLAQVRADIEQILPGTQVIEQGTKALARAESRAKVGQEAKAAIDRERRHRTQMRSEREFFAAVLSEANHVFVSFEVFDHGAAWRGAGDPCRPWLWQVARTDAGGAYRRNYRCRGAVQSRSASAGPDHGAGANRCIRLASDAGRHSTGPGRGLA